MTKDDDRAIAKREPSAMARAEDTAMSPGEVAGAIVQLARDPNLDVDKLGKLFEWQERLEARAAEREFTRAFVRMRKKLPRIRKSGTMEIRAKRNPDEVVATVPYALFEDIQAECWPVLDKHGFSLTFDYRYPPGEVETIGILRHEAGHVERAHFQGPYDKTGAKNETQARSSSGSYGRRNVTIALLSLITYGEDDDATAAGRFDHREGETVAGAAGVTGAAPEGLEDWITDMESAADEGWPALSKAWDQTDKDRQRWILNHRASWWDRVKARATRAGGQRKR